MTQFAQDTAAIKTPRLAGHASAIAVWGSPDVLRWCSASSSRALWMTTPGPCSTTPDSEGGLR